MHLAHVIADGLDDAVDERLLKLDVAQALHNTFLVVHDLLLHAEDALIEGRALVETRIEGLFLAINVLHFFKKLDDPLALVHLFLGRVVFLDGLDDVFELHAPFFRSSPTRTSSSTATGTSTRAYMTSSSPASIFLAM